MLRAPHMWLSGWDSPLVRDTIGNRLAADWRKGSVSFVGRAYASTPLAAGRPRLAGLIGVMLSVLAGCSSASSSHTSRTTADPHVENRARVVFKSPVVVAGKLPVRYTCDGADLAPPLEWSAVPANTKELAILVLGLTPEPGTNTSAVSIEWAVAGIDPALHRLASGALPHGAHVGRGGKGRYDVCPPKGATEQYEFTLYAVPPSLKVPKRFIGLQLLRLLALRESSAGTTAGGHFIVSYKRK